MCQLYIKKAGGKTEKNEKLFNIKGHYKHSKKETTDWEKTFPKHVYKKRLRASLVAQWLKIHRPMQGTWVRALVREDPTCRGATKPACHNY